MESIHEHNAKEKKTELSRGWGTWLLNIIEAESTVQGLWRAGAPLKTVGVHVDAERLGEAVHWHVGGARWGLGWVEHHPTEPGWIVLDYCFQTCVSVIWLYCVQDHGWSWKEVTCRRRQQVFHFEQRGRWCSSRTGLSTSQWSSLFQPGGRHS